MNRPVAMDFRMGSQGGKNIRILFKQTVLGLHFG
jgi:hypothetical protein